MRLSSICAVGPRSFEAAASRAEMASGSGLARHVVSAGEADYRVPAPLMSRSAGQEEGKIIARGC